MKFIDLTGQKFGRLIPVKYLGNRKWKCECECGNNPIIIGNQMVRGFTKSCGCFRKEATRERHSTHGYSGSIRSREYIAWCAMKQRCLYKNHIGYHQWGGRGIAICDRWLGEDGFVNFLSDMGTKPTKKHTLDRIDNDGNYEPSNCRWSTVKEQSANRRSNRMIELDGVVKSLDDWSEIANVNRITIHSRLKAGWGIKDAIFEKPRYIGVRGSNQIKPSV
jgi:hypothetical protein